MAEPKAKIVIDADGADVLKEARKITKAMQGLGNDVRSAFERGVADSGRLLTDLSERAGQVFGVLRSPLALATTGIAALGAAAYKVGQAALNVGGAFDKSMANVSTLVDTTQIDMEELGRQALRTALDFRRSPALIADALYEWISANGRIDDGLQDFRASVKASVGGVTEAKTAVDGVTTIMNAYGKEAGGATRVSDLMFQTVNKGKINFTELASQIGLVISTAKGANVPLNDLMAAIATATAQGVRPSSAMEGLRSAISNIIKPTDQAKVTAKLLGIQWGAAALKAKGLAGLLKEVREKTKGNVETMTQLFGDVSGLSVVLALTGEGAGMFADNLTIMAEAGGSTDAAFRKQRKTWEEVAAGLVTLGQVAASEIFNKFKPYLMEAGQWVLDNWPGVREQLSQTANDLASLVSVGLEPFKLAWGGAKAGVEVVLQLLRGDLQGAAEAAKQGLKDLTNELVTFKSTWEGIQVPEWVKWLGGAAAGFAALRLGLSGATLALNGIAAAMEGLSLALEALAAGSLVAFIGKLVSGGGLTQALGRAGLSLAEVVAQLAGVAIAVLRSIPGWGWIAAAVIGAGLLIWKNWDWLKQKAGEIWTAIKDIAVNAVQGISTFFTQTIPGWWQAFKQWLDDTYTGIKTWFAELPGKLGESIGFVTGWLSVKIPEWWAAFGTWLDNTLTGITAWFHELPGKITSAVQSVGTWLSANVPAMWNAFTGWMSGLATDLATFFTELPGKFTTWLTNAANALSGLWDTFKAKGRELGIQVWEGLKSSVTGAISDAVSSAKNFISGLKKGFAEGREAAGGGSQDIPEFGVGAVIRQRMLAIVGEKGTEAIVPKSDAASWLPLIAQWAGLTAASFAAPSFPALAGVAGGGGASISLGGVTVIVQAPAGTENPRAWGAAAGDALFQRLATMIKL